MRITLTVNISNDTNLSQDKFAKMSFDDLPRELYHLIINELDLDSFCNLRSTSKYAKYMCDSVVYRAIRKTEEYSLSFGLLDGKLHGKYKCIDYGFCTELVCYYNHGVTEGPHYLWCDGKLESLYHYKGGSPDGDCYKILAYIGIQSTDRSSLLVKISTYFQGNEFSGGNKLMNSLPIQKCEDENHTNCPYKR
jgi:hypothetical protein